MDVRVNIENISTGISLRRLCIFILALRVTRERTSHSSLKGNYGREKQGDERAEGKRDDDDDGDGGGTARVYAEEPWLYFRPRYYYLETVNFSRQDAASSRATSERKLREEYQHAQRRCRCDDFSPMFRDFRDASFLTRSHEKERIFFTRDISGS